MKVKRVAGTLGAEIGGIDLRSLSDEEVAEIRAEELRAKLKEIGVAQAQDDRRQSGRTSRLLARLHTYGLVAKVPRSRRWRVSTEGSKIMSAAIRLREERFPLLHSQSGTQRPTAAAA
jgi:hypothetical protein